MDIATIIGLVLSLGGVVGGFVLEGGHVTALVQPTAAMIVLGGTFGATFVSFPLSVILKAFRDAGQAFFPPSIDLRRLVEDIGGYASKVRKDGLISLEQEAQEIRDPFLKQGLSMIVDGADPQQFRLTMEIEMETFQGHAKASAEYFEAAGGYAPTIGIIGAVLGLIHVMANLSDAGKLGAGIAVAFVATIYGLATANIFCLPISTKLKHHVKERMREKELILEGLLSLLQGEHPRLIEQKLMAYLHERPQS